MPPTTSTANLMNVVNYPKLITDNWDYRAQLWSKAEKDEQFKAAIKEQCAKDILFWLNCFVYIHEPRSDKLERHKASSARIPFITYKEYQDEYILKLVDHIVTGKDILTEKSRDMGVSWMVIVVFIWFWQFGGAGNDFLMGSRKQEYVDKAGDMAALFPKARHVLKYQPKWLLPEGFDMKKHSRFMMIENPITGSTITGEANNADFGSGDRRKAVLVDEFAKWRHTDDQAWQSLGDVTDCRIPVSSARGKNNRFYRLKNQEEVTIEVARLHWKQHPHKDAAWYEREKTRRSPSELAAEVDINYAASVTNKAYPSYDENIHVRPVPIDLHTPLTLMCDFNINPMSWAVGQEYGGYAKFVGELSLSSVSTPAAAEAFARKYKSHINKQVFIFGDASGQNRQRAVPGLPSEYGIIRDILKQRGWAVSLHLPRGNPLVPESVEALDKRFCDWENKGKSWITIDPSCKKLIESFEQTQRTDGGIDKDGTEHMTDGPRGWAAFKYPISQKSRSYKS